MGLQTFGGWCTYPAYKLNWYPFKLAEAVKFCNEITASQWYPVIRSTVKLFK